MPGTRVFIGRLSSRADEHDVERFFRNYGRIKEMLLKRGFGFVEFEDHRDADDAVYELNGKELCGERVSVEHARGTPRGRDRGRGYGPRRGYDDRPRRGGGMGRDSRYGPPQRSDYRVLVENLSSRVSWQDLKDYMRKAGEVIYADAHRQRKNEGVVEFASYEDMKNAISKLDDTEINGRVIRVVEDRPSRGKRDASRSRSRSRSRESRRSRSRSRSNSRSRSRSKSGSKSSKSRSRSPSKSPANRQNGEASPDDNKDD